MKLTLKTFVMLPPHLQLFFSFIVLRDAIVYFIYFERRD